jgi:hypothetical protein
MLRVVERACGHELFSTVIVEFVLSVRGRKMCGCVWEEGWRSRVRDGRADTNNQSRGSATRSSMEDDGIWVSRERRQQFTMLP